MTITWKKFDAAAFFNQGMICLASPLFPFCPSLINEWDNAWLRGKGQNGKKKKLTQISDALETLGDAAWWTEVTTRSAQFRFNKGAPKEESALLRKTRCQKVSWQRSKEKEILYII
jgi:hypothetical protein